VNQSNPDFEMPEMPLPPQPPPEDDFPCCSQPAPSCCKSGSNWLTAAEVKVLTEEALRLGRKEALEDAIEAIEGLRAPVTLTDHSRGWNSGLQEAADRLRFIAKATHQPSGAVSDEHSGGDA
jgi:hypothetical protein